MAGYYDSSGNWIPTEFASSGFPTQGDDINEAAAQRARTALDKEAAIGRGFTGKMQAADRQIAALKKQLAKKGISAVMKRGIQHQITKQNAIRASAIKARDASISKQTKLQNTYYETSGQFDKLLSGANRDAFMAVNALFKSYGLDSLAGKVYEYVKNGYSGDTISILLQDTPEYKQRFAGNEARLKAGLPVLSPGEYLATEASYRQIMSTAGLPAGFYDSPGDFSNWIGKNVSPSEIQTRVDLASQATVLANPDYRKALNQMGISNSQLTAYFLDPKKSLPILQKSAATAAVGGAALAQGLTFDKAYSEQLALQGISQEEATQGYSQIAAELDTMRAIGTIYGEQWGQRESEEAIFEGSGEQVQKKARLLSQERGAFSGAAGGGRAGLGQAGGAR